MTATSVVLVGKLSVAVFFHHGRWYRIFHLFLCWSTYIAGTGGATCFMITSVKNRNSYNRKEMITQRLNGANNKSCVALDKKTK